MGKKLIAANWKMNKTNFEAMLFLDKFLPEARKIRDAEIVLCPPYTALAEVYRRIEDTKIMLGAQNMHFEENGAFTGSISALMLKEIGCEYVIIGHSERRQYKGDTDEIINLKIKSALKHGLKPILCAGEKPDQRESRLAHEIIRTQITRALQGIDNISSIVIAYEPVWAIGTGKTASPKQAQEAHHFIRGILQERYGSASKKTRIIYGGSVTSENIKALMKEKDIDGALVGGASLEPDKLLDILAAA